MISSILTAWAELFYPKGKKVQQDDLIFISNKGCIDIGQVLEIFDGGRVTIRYASYIRVGAHFLRAHARIDKENIVVRIL